jgi:hypothetical protein
MDRSVTRTPTSTAAIDAAILGVPESVLAARRLLPRIWAGEDVLTELELLAATARSRDDIPG